ncbi:coiled-coil domain-containing protein 112-like, partial [Asbolus verrucosus]
EVKEFLDFVSKSNGHENGWSSDDHHLFLKIRNKYKDIENLALNMNKILPGTQLVKRVYFLKYLNLFQILVQMNKKDEALERWRRAKSENTDQKDNEINDNNRNAVKNMLFKPTDRSVHEKIALWRAEKEAKRQQEQIYEQMQKERLNRVEDERRRLHEQLKKSVAKWKEEKLTKEQSEKLQKEIMEYQERKIRAAEANHMIKRFQAQDDIFIVKMKHNKLKEKNEVKRSKSSYIANRDPERILKPTKQWLLRTSKDNFMDSQVPVFVSNVRTIPKL